MYIQNHGDKNAKAHGPDSYPSFTKCSRIDVTKTGCRERGYGPVRADHPKLSEIAFVESWIFYFGVPAVALFNVPNVGPDTREGVINEAYQHSYGQNTTSLKLFVKFVKIDLLIYQNLQRPNYRRMRDKEFHEYQSKDHKNSLVKRILTKDLKLVL